MLNKSIQKLSLADIFSGNIVTRAAVAAIAQQVDNSAQKVLLDFSKIDFISRSFTHELLRFIKNNPQPIELINLNEALKTMMQLVQNSKPTSEIKPRSIPEIRLSEQMNAF